MGGVILATLLATSSCQDENLVDNPSPQSNQITLTASYAVSSRTHLGKDGKQTVWSENDKIYVSDADGKITGTLYIDPADAGKSEATFNGFVKGGSPSKLVYSVYPVPTNGKIDLSQVTGGDKLNAPMVGQINNGHVPFKNTCGVLRVNLPQSKGQNISIEAKAANENDNAQSVKFLTSVSVEVDNNGVAKLVYTAEEGSDKGKITINNAEGGFMYVPYYITQDVDVFVGGTKITTITKNVTAENGQTKENGFIGALKEKNVKTLVYSETTKGFIEATDATINTESVSDGQLVIDLTSTTEEDGEGSSFTTATSYEFINIPSITEATTNGSTTTINSVVVELPKIETTSTATSSVVSFEEIPESTPVTIQEKSDTGNQGSIEELTIILPSEKTKESLTVDLPATTVTVQSNDGASLNIKKVVAATADNTFIIKENVTIKELFAVRGSIEVSGIVESLVRDAAHLYGDSKVSVLIKKGGQVKNTLDSSIFNVEYEGDAPIVDEPEEPETPDEPTESVVTIENAGLSTALLNAYGNDTVTINSNGYAEIAQSLVEKMTTVILEGMTETFTLTGIEAFTKLERLVICENSFTEMAVSTLPSSVKILNFEQNTSLSSLSFESNPSLESVSVFGSAALKSLDITNLPNLTFFLAGNNATLDEITFPTNSKIESLDLVENAFTEVDLSPLKNSLISLVIDGNKLTSLTASGFSKLEHVDCIRNNIKTLDFSNCPSLENIEFRENPIESINISGCSSYTELQCIELGTVTSLNVKGCTALQILDCPGNKLTSLDLSDCTALNRVTCYKNQLTQLDLSNQTLLKELVCGSQTDKDGKSITLKLLLNDKMKEQWNSNWSNVGENKDTVESVDELEEDTPSSEASGNTSGNGFNIETIY